MSKSPKIYYRNLTEIEGCEPESLWVLQDRMLVLVDDDEYVQVSLEENQDVFYEVADPIPEN